jgi:hypothetical protein
MVTGTAEEEEEATALRPPMVRRVVLPVLLPLVGGGGGGVARGEGALALGLGLLALGGGEGRVVTTVTGVLPLTLSRKGRGVEEALVEGFLRALGRGEGAA